MNILVTGAAGFIGSHVCEHFVHQGHFIIGLDNFDDFYSPELKRANLINLNESNHFKFCETDIRDARGLNAIFDVYQVDVVMHLAAKAGVRPSIDAIGDYYDVNVNGTITLLEAMKSRAVKKMIFASSSSVYGNNKKIPFAETDFVDNPISPYASTKKSGELLCHVYSHLHGFDITCLRLFTVYGQRQRPDLAIHKFTRLINENKPIPVFGDGSSARDYTYIDDIVQGISGALDHLGGYRMYNLGGSKVIDLNELIKTIEHALQKKAVLNILPQQPGDVYITNADISRAKKEIGYNPQTSLETGIQNFVKWYLEFIEKDLITLKPGMSCDKIY